MEPGGSMSHSQGLSNNPYPEQNQQKFHVLIPISLRYILIFSSHLRLGLPKRLFPVGATVTFLKGPLSSSILVFKILTSKPTGKRDLGRPWRR